MQNTWMFAAAILAIGCSKTPDTFHLDASEAFAGTETAPARDETSRSITDTDPDESSSSSPELDTETAADTSSSSSPELDTETAADTSSSSSPELDTETDTCRTALDLCPPMNITLPNSGTYYVNCFDCDVCLTGECYGSLIENCDGLISWKPDDIPPQMELEGCTKVICC